VTGFGVKKEKSGDGFAVIGTGGSVTVTGGSVTGCAVIGSGDTVGTGTGAGTAVGGIDIAER